MRHQVGLAREAARIKRFGHVRPVIYAIQNGRTTVAVGKSWYSSTAWRTFPDFLGHYMTCRLFPEWGNAELAKPAGERHFIVDWYQRLCHLQAKQTPMSDGVVGYVPNGAASAYLNLAYDLYTLDHHESLPSEILERLKCRNKYQAVRHEIFAAAACLRAGCDIVHEDESDLTRPHAEFRAQHRASGERVWVEAKSMCRRGVLAFPDDDGRRDASVGAKAYSLLDNVRAKRLDGPVVVFLDVNLPPDDHSDSEPAWFAEVKDAFCDVGDFTADQRDPYNLAIFSSFAHHYGDDGLPDPGCPRVPMYSPKARHPMSEPLIHAIIEGVRLYGNIPNTFEEGATVRERSPEAAGWKPPANGGR